MLERITKKWLFVLLLIVCPTVVVSATEVQQVETQGTIGFTGIYEEIGKPDPIPTAKIEEKKPAEMAISSSGSLPKTNEIEQVWFKWLGILIIGFVTLHIKKILKSKKKVGIIQ